MQWFDGVLTLILLMGQMSRKLDEALKEAFIKAQIINVVLQVGRKQNTQRKPPTLNVKVYEPRHDKTNNGTVRPAKTQISLGPG